MHTAGGNELHLLRSEQQIARYIKVTTRSSLNSDKGLYLESYFATSYEDQEVVLLMARV